jgi:membrane peptidoglycan carboxypeptidase
MVSAMMQPAAIRIGISRALAAGVREAGRLRDGARRWRSGPTARPGRVRRRRCVLGVVTVFAVLASPVVGGTFAAFRLITVPESVRLSQASVLYYSDGVTELTRIGVLDRTVVKLADVPLVVRHAVLAAEDRTFHEHAGISWKGVGRAIVSNATPGENTQGASTITQQFVKNTYLGSDRTVSRKIEEAVLAIKVERRFSKDQILEGYLNTI